MLQLKAILTGARFFIIAAGIAGAAWYHVSALDAAREAERDKLEKEFAQRQIDAVDKALTLRDQIEAIDDKIVNRMFEKLQARESRLLRQIEDLKAYASEQRSQSGSCNVPVGTVRLLNDETRRSQGVAPRGRLPIAEGKAASVVTGTDFEQWAFECASRYAGLKDRHDALVDAVKARQ